ncbi:MAG: hypothetical protein KC800_03545 [Candidatus Eremiobacteraeota bacterium]|nr:hypothetical protein [Candidatus Eremiobacteraeota bacterium]
MKRSDQLKVSLLLACLLGLFQFSGCGDSGDFEEVSGAPAPLSTADASGPEATSASFDIRFSGGGFLANPRPLVPSPQVTVPAAVFTPTTRPYRSFRAQIFDRSEPRRLLQIELARSTGLSAGTQLQIDTGTKLTFIETPRMSTANKFFDSKGGTITIRALTQNSIELSFDNVLMRNRNAADQTFSLSGRASFSGVRLNIVD